MSLTNSLLIGKSSLLTRQTQMSVIGNNVSNADNVSYRRQTAEIVSNQPIQRGKLILGTGSNVNQVLRSFDEVMEGNLRGSMQQSGFYEDYSTFVGLAESVMAPDGASPLSNQITEFANALQDLANTPESSTARNTLINRANDVASSFNQQTADLTNIKTNLADATTGAGAIQDNITVFNDLAADVAELNNTISQLENKLFNPQQANDLRDRRDAVIQNMSKLADISVTEQSDTTYTVTLGGKNVVAGTTVDTINMAMASDVPVLTWASDSSSVTLTNGKIFGGVQARAYVVNRITDQTSFVTAFASQLNTAQTAGFDLAGTAGTNLFDASTPTNMTVLISDPNLIAASDNNANTGDGDNARNMFDSMNVAVGAIGNDTLLNHNDNLVDAVAAETAQANMMLETSKNSEIMFSEAVQRRSGVNIDEEMVDMLEVQRAYQASARFVSVVDSMLGTVLSI